jgi:outer membrane protein OmpA-like peptidoglycan-associated protein
MPAKGGSDQPVPEPEPPALLHADAGEEAKPEAVPAAAAEPIPEPAPIHAPKPHFVPHSIVRFGYNSNDLSVEAYSQLNRLSAYLKEEPAATLVIKGYTDSYGSDGYNLSLSKFRANIVKNYLIGNGVSSRRITAVGLGALDPLQSNDTLAGREANRRVEIEIRTP